MKMVLRWCFKIKNYGGYMLKLWDKIMIWFRFNRKNSDNIKRVIKIYGDNANVNASTSSGNTASLKDVGTVFLNQNAGSNFDGRRRKAIRNIKTEANNLCWAIQQSTDPKVTNTPKNYQTKLKIAYDTNYEFLTSTDIELLDSLILIVIDFRKGFIELENPLIELLNVLESLK
jgi:hypothetical protein